MTRPRCFNCDRPARPGSMFCTQRCAAVYAETLLEGFDDVFCPVTERWESVLDGECCGCASGPEADGHIRSNQWRACP